MTAVKEEPFIVQNAIRTPDGTLLVSSYRHDYRNHTDTSNGVFYAVDGGTDYLKRTEPSGYEELSILSDEPFEKVREKLLWGSYGILGDEPLEFMILKDMTTRHLVNVISFLSGVVGRLGKITQYRINMFQEEISHRLPTKVGNNSGLEGINYEQKEV